MFRSLLAMHFLLVALMHWPMEIQMRHSESRLGAAGTVQAKHSSDGLEECESGQGMAWRGGEGGVI
jgi:hypothetical protein